MFMLSDERDAGRFPISSPGFLFAVKLILQRHVLFCFSLQLFHPV